MRDGRPFNPTPGARAASLPFPYPSTTTGGVRTRAGIIGASGAFDPNSIAAVKNIHVRGPLLVALTQAGDFQEWLAPAPADALLLEADNAASTEVICKRLVPLALPNGASLNLGDDISPVGLIEFDPVKPYGQPVRFWHWEKFNEWLLNPSSIEGKTNLAAIGCYGPARESRTHVGIQPETQTAIQPDPQLGTGGSLFQTRGLEFTEIDRTNTTNNTRLATARRLALAVAIDNSTNPQIQPGVAPLGGERRLVCWRKTETMLPACPAALREEIKGTGACRVILLTPAIFSKGFYPEWICQPRGGVTPKVAAIRVERH